MDQLSEMVSFPGVNKNSQKLSCPHIKALSTDLYFQEEIAKIAGISHCDIKSNTRQHQICLKACSPSNSLRLCIYNSAPYRREEQESPSVIHITVFEELGDRIGVLYTDAAHTVLCDLGPEINRQIIMNIWHLKFNMTYLSH